MTDEKRSPAQELLDRLNGDILAACDRRDKAKAQIIENERDWWVRSHKLETAEARYILETADLRVQRHFLTINMGMMHQDRPIAVINLNQFT